MYRCDQCNIRTYKANSSHRCKQSPIHTFCDSCYETAIEYKCGKKLCLICQPWKYNTNINDYDNIPEGFCSWCYEETSRLKESDWCNGNVHSFCRECYKIAVKNKTYCFLCDLGSFSMWDRLKPPPYKFKSIQ